MLHSAPPLFKCSKHPPKGLLFLHHLASHTHTHILLFSHWVCPPPCILKTGRALWEAFCAVISTSLARAPCSRRVRDTEPWCVCVWESRSYGGIWTARVTVSREETWDIMEWPDEMWFELCDQGVHFGSDLITQRSWLRPGAAAAQRRAEVA